MADEDIPTQSQFKKFLQGWLINTLAVLLAVYVVPGIHFASDNYWIPFVASLLLGMLNAFVRPILMLLALPLLIFTLGLFTLVINALLLWLVGSILDDFRVDGFWPAFWGAIIIGVATFFLNLVTGTGRAKVTVRRGSSSSRRDDDDGPVIDV